ncbi:MAG: cell division FtsZ family protein [Deltaproteobacteria bacterium]|jgi:cell division protein FtsZ|nr:cell division FtsZ family protein [Deltaproteobacteria bacterium]
MDKDSFTPKAIDSLADPGRELEFVDGGGPKDLHKIVVVGLGGCGNNAINYMVKSGLKGPIFVAANSDLQALNLCQAKLKVQLGVKTAAGHGCGGDPAVGRRCAEENLDELLAPLKGADMAFLMAGLGGGTGSGAIPVLAEALTKRENPPLVVGVVTRPFPWEDYRDPLADEVIGRLRRSCNSVIVIPNAKIFELDPDLPFMKAKEKVDDVLYRAVGSISYLIERVGVINVDFADVSRVMAKKGSAIMGYGEASGDKRAQLALEAAIANPLMSNRSLKGAKGVLVNVTGDALVTSSEFAAINSLVHNEIGQGVEFFSGLMIDESLSELKTLKVTVVATGLDYDESLDEGDWGDEEFSEADLGLGDLEEAELDESEMAEGEMAEGEMAEGLRAARGDFVVLDPMAEEPAQAERAAASGRLAPVLPSRRESLNLSLPLTPTEARGPAAPPGDGLLGPRFRSKYEKLGVEQVYAKGEFFDLPPYQRKK